MPDVRLVRRSLRVDFAAGVRSSCTPCRDRSRGDTKASGAPRTAPVGRKRAVAELFLALCGTVSYHTEAVNAVPQRAGRCEADGSRADRPAGRVLRRAGARLAILYYTI